MWPAEGKALHAERCGQKEQVAEARWGPRHLALGKDGLSSGTALSFRPNRLQSKSPATRNRTRDHLIPAMFYSQMLCQLSYSRLFPLSPAQKWHERFPSYPGRWLMASSRRPQQRYHGLMAQQPRDYKRGPQRSSGRGWWHDPALPGPSPHDSQLLL